jgi:hypothetical protein
MRNLLNDKLDIDNEIPMTKKTNMISIDIHYNN